MAVLNAKRQNATPEGIERRTSRRRPLRDIPTISAVKVQTESVQVLNASSGGLLIEGSLRLLPGTPSQLEIIRVDGPMRVCGRVVRSEVSGIIGRTLQYRIAIAFDRPLDFIDLDPASKSLEAPAAGVGESADTPPLLDTDEGLTQHLTINGW